VAEEAEVEAHVPAQQPETSEAARLSQPDADARGPGDPPHQAPEGPRPPLGLIGSVGDRATFDALARDGRRGRQGPVTVSYLPAEAAPRPSGDRVRVAYAIGRRVGPAVTRNRVRRRLREAVRALDRASGGLPAGAYLVSVRPSAAGASYAALRDDLGAACALATTPATTPAARAGGRSPS
jgi:ribonuclease P protein component